MRRWMGLALLLSVSGCGKSVRVPQQTSTLVENDRDLYNTAMKALRKNRFVVAQLQLQTLLDTYEDSEYSAQAKYAYADTFYYQAGHSNLLLAESEFRKFLTFFPQHDLADDAQLKIAMTHIKQLQKPDRDDTEARLAEYELEAMIKDPTYSSSDLLDEAKEKLRAVQEILAESILGPAKQYYRRGAYISVVSRCEEILKKYPDFSGTDRVLYLLGETYRKAAPEQSTPYYSRIVRDYPLSDLVKDSKKRLLELQADVPEPNPIALNRARQQQEENGKNSAGLFGLGLFGGGTSAFKDTKAASSKDPRSELSVVEGEQ